VRLPEELLVRARIGSRAHAELGDEGIVVSGAGEPAHPGPRDGQPPAPGLAENGAVLAQARGVDKRYGAGSHEIVVLDGLDADFRAGRLTALTGPSGAGKTTLLHILAGLRDPSAGSASVLGSDLVELGREGRAALRRDPIAFIPQDPALTPFLSARENVEVALALRDMSAAEALERALDALSEVGLAERAEQRVARLSAGERQRVAIARALATEAKLLLADEPTARLDEANALAVSALFGRYAREQGAAVVCATHDPLVVAEADDVLAL
jgi:putative ABC transport system ATP-binding protein